MVFCRSGTCDRLWSRYLILWSSTTGVGASRASMTICRAVCRQSVVVVRQRSSKTYRELYRLTSLPTSVVGSSEHGKNSYSKGCRHIVGYMLIICLSMADIKAYILASYDISASPSGSRDSHREAA